MARFQATQSKDIVVALLATVAATLGIRDWWGLLFVVAVGSAVLLQRTWPRATVAVLLVLQQELTVAIIVLACFASHITWRRGSHCCRC